MSRPRRPPASVRVPRLGTMAARAAVWALSSCALPGLAPPPASHAQSRQAPPQQPPLADLSLEELMQLEVTSVSRREEPLFEAAAAVHVITQEDLRRSGATSLAEVLRLVPGLQVARVNSSQWAITARGFNNQFANKLLVLIDGRSVYTPLFAGVYWDVQDLVLDHVERIEVIRGPGATLWGANAVNGVINVITKSAAETPGWFVTAGGGSEERAFGGASFGARAGTDMSYRVYGKYLARDRFVDASGKPAADDWWVGRGGFRLDWKARATDLVSLQGDGYGGRLGRTTTSSTPQPPYTVTADSRARVAGGNLLGRWNHALSPRSRTTLQAYYDLTERRDTFHTETRATADLDFQHEITAGRRQEIIWGLGYRLTTDELDGTFVFSLNPPSRTDHLFSCFVQDEIALQPGKLRFTLGTKLEHNSYTDFEVQPSARLLWTPHRRHTAWGAVSRAVRTPSRVEDDVRFILGVFPVADTLQTFALLGNRGLEADELLAWEIGYRTRPTERVFVDLAAFYNVYHDLGTFEPRTPFFEAEPPPPHVLRPLHIENLGSGETYGVEMAASCEVGSRWRLSAGSSWFHIQLHRDPSSHDTSTEIAEGSDPAWQIQARSQLDLPGRLGLDVGLGYVGELPGQRIPESTRLDVLVFWRATAHLRLSVAGQNLLEAHHPEFGGAVTTAQATEVQRGFYGRAVWRY